MLTQRLHHVLALHFDKEYGSSFWIDRARELHTDPVPDGHSISDLAIMGTTSQEDYAGRPLRDFIPRRFHCDLDRFVIGQTGGATGSGLWTAYREDEFRQAFIEPFGMAISHVGFPRGGNWLYAGPSGPHLIGKVVRDLALAADSHDPFSVDFDPRWVRKLPADSLSRTRFLDHVVTQMMEIINCQSITVIFTTPAVLHRLAQTMSKQQRFSIRGVHYGGMEVRQDDLHEFQQEYFPKAVHLCGYGNKLFGCCLEVSVEAERTPAYFPYGSRLYFETVDEEGGGVDAGSVGRVCFTRLDESFLIIRMMERDEAQLVPLPDNPPPGFMLPGLRGPRTPKSVLTRDNTGLY